jgi:hypothetical protein
MNAGTYYRNLLEDPQTRNGITTAGQCQQLIDQMEEDVPHDELPPCYDWLVARRNRLMCNVKGEHQHAHQLALEQQ